MLGIVTAPDPVLSQIAQPVKKLDREILSLIEEMKETLLATSNPKGVGLAAVQVGRPLRIFVMKPWEKSPITVCIDPEIAWESQEKTEEGVPQRQNKLEGCLSLPTIWGMVKRAKQVKLRYQTLPNLSDHPNLPNKLQTRTKTFSGFAATIIQHEMDHLNGILFPKRVLEQKGKLYKSKKDEKREEVFEEIEI